MAQVVAPQNRKDNKSNLLPTIGTIGGAVIGGVLTGGAGAPAGAAIGGASLGAGLGGAAGTLGANFSSNEKPGVSLIENQGVRANLARTDVESIGMDRRMSQIDNDPLEAIRQAQMAINALPPEQIPQTRAALNDAYSLAKRNQSYT